MKVSRHKPDALYSLLTRGRAENRCERCGVSGGRLECSHRWPRGIKALRWHPDNSDCLCFQCHRWWHSHSPEAGDWLRTKIGRAKYDWLFEAAHRADFKMNPALKAHITGKLQTAWDEMQRLRATGFEGRIDFASPYDGEVQPLARKPRKAKAKKTGPKKKIQSRPFPKEHRPLRKQAA